MPTNYKNVDQKPPKRTGIAAKVLLLFLLLVVAVLGILGSYFWQTRDTEELILTGQYDPAIQKLDHWTWLPFYSAHVYEEIGTARLLQQGSASAAAFFEKSETRALFRPMSIWSDVLKTLWSTGRYEDGYTYATHLDRKLSAEPILHYYKAGFLTGRNQLPEATKELAAAGNIPEFTNELALLKSEIELRTATGQHALIFDRENLPVMNLDAKDQPVYISESVRPILNNSQYDLFSKIQDRKTQVVLSIDYRLQNAAIRALDGYAGAIVLLDVEKGDILAAASSLKGVRSEYPEGTQLAFFHQYEPGSIVKLMTLSGGIEKGVDLTKVFPYQCEGSLKLRDEKVLYCWAKHETVPDMDKATAVSCNVGFAKIGLAMKPADLLGNLRTFGFNSRVQTDLLSTDLGKTEENEIDDLSVSYLSIGLEKLSMTPLHIAMLAASIANGGMSITPRLFLSNRNVIGIPFGAKPPVEFGRFMSSETAKKLTQAMQHVVTDPDGTGRRAMIDGLPFAIKTGTAGKSVTGYNAIITGFAPVTNPKIAFGIVLEHAGKAEFEGARVTRLFLESVRGYIK